MSCVVEFMAFVMEFFFFLVGNKQIVVVNHVKDIHMASP